MNLRTVLFNCIHPALASITEVDDNQERSIKRIKFIFKELNKSNQLTEGNSQLRKLFGRVSFQSNSVHCQYKTR